VTERDHATLVFLTVHERIESVHACVAEGALGYVVESRVVLDPLTALREAALGAAIHVLLRFQARVTDLLPVF
jgi:DNA-binding NarL/FixJ family response regulator